MSERPAVLLVLLGGARLHWLPFCRELRGLAIGGNARASALPMALPRQVDILGTGPRVAAGLGANEDFSWSEQHQRNGRRIGCRAAPIWARSRRLLSRQSEIRLRA